MGDLQPGRNDKARGIEVAIAGCNDEAEDEWERWRMPRR